MREQVKRGWQFPSTKKWKFYTTLCYDATNIKTTRLAQHAVPVIDTPRFNASANPEGQFSTKNPPGFTEADGPDKSTRDSTQLSVTQPQGVERYPAEGSICPSIEALIRKGRAFLGTRSPFRSRRLCTFVPAAKRGAPRSRPILGIRRGRWVGKAVAHASGYAERSKRSIGVGE